MPVDHIRYDLLVREALRGVVRHVVADVAKNGLPGEHHFYIAFDTGAPGVRISTRLRAQYPEEMTIVLQHQFWDLTVSDVGIEVGLSFGGIPEKLFVPFDAIKGFFDPSVQFGLEFEVAGEKDADKGEGEVASSVPPATSEESSPRVTSRRSGAGKKPLQSNDSLATADKAAEPAEQKAEQLADSGRSDDPDPEGGAQVVSLDRFRKK